MGSQVLPENLIQCELLSPWDCRFCQEPVPLQASHRVTASIRQTVSQVWSPLWAANGSAMDLHGLQGDNLPHHDLHHGLQGHLCSCAGALLPPPSLSSVPARLFLEYIFTLLSAAIAHIFSMPLNTLSQSCYYQR